MRQLTTLALVAALTTATLGTALSDTDFGALRYDPMAAIEAGDQLGLEVIPRTELEEVRGEGFTFSWSSWAWNRVADMAVAGGVIICGATAPCVVAASVYAAYRVLEQPIYEAAYVTALYR
jgi:hypothetical protein